MTTTPEPAPELDDVAMTDPLGDLDLGGITISEEQYRRLADFATQHRGHDLRFDNPARTLSCFTCTHTLTVHDNGSWSADLGHLDLSNGSTDSVLEQLSAALEAGTVTDAAGITAWLNDRGYVITVAGDQAELPQVPDYQVDALADRLPGDATTRRDGALSLLRLLAIDGWQLAPLHRDTVEKEESPVDARVGYALDPWQRTEMQREALGLAKDLVVAGQLTPEGMVAFADQLAASLVGAGRLPEAG